MVSTNSSLRKGTPLFPQGAEVKVLANHAYPHANGILLASDVSPGFAQVQVVGGDHDGQVWTVYHCDVELISETPIESSLQEKAGTTNSLPECQVGVKPSSSNESVNACEVDITRVMPSAEDEPPAPNVRVFTPSAKPRILRKARRMALGKGVGKTEGYPKGFKKGVKTPLLRSEKLKVLKSLDQPTTANFQEVQKGLYAHPDWIQATGVVSHHQTVLQYLANVFGEEVFFEPSTPWVQGKVWKSSGRCVNGFRIGFNPRKKEDGGGLDVMVSFPGALLSSRHPIVWWQMCATLRRMMGFKCTRFDAALDDMEKELDPKLIKEAILAGNVRYFNADSCVFTDSTKDGGWNIRMGGAGSDASLNFYNKEAESAGELPSYRLEVRLRRTRAEQALNAWLAIGLKNFAVDSAKVLAGLVVGKYDFIDRRSMPNEKHLDRIPRLPWWQKFLDRVNVEPIRHPRIRPDWSVERFQKWFRKQLVTSLAAFRKAVGVETFYNWLDAELDEAEANKMKPWHWHRVQKFKDEIRHLASV